MGNQEKAWTGTSPTPRRSGGVARYEMAFEPGSGMRAELSWMVTVLPDAAA